MEITLIFVSQVYVTHLVNCLPLLDWAGCEEVTGNSLLSLEYLLFVERWPHHMEPPDHYDRLSSLLDLSVSQSG